MRFKNLNQIDYDAIRRFDRERVDPGILNLMVKGTPPHVNRQLTTVPPKNDLVKQMKSHPLAKGNKPERVIRIGSFC